tara:strand:- start:2974 stop:3852 length:879 start_codon:yes stop_codon:yes gene_type:complete
MTQKKVLILFGPTSCGKSDTAIKIAKNIQSNIINADSIQIYKDLRILTSRPSEIDEKKVAHKLYGVIDGKNNCSVAAWLDLVTKEIKTCWSEDKLPILVGGTGMYLKSLMEGISDIPEVPASIKLGTEEELEKYGVEYLYNQLIELNQETKVTKQDTQRVMRALNVIKSTGKSIEEWQTENKKLLKEVNFEVFIPQFNRNELYKRSEHRFDAMLANGAVQEVRNLLDQNLDSKQSIMKAIGVREIKRYLDNEISKQDCINLSKKNTRNYIKRQITWIRGNNISSNIDIKKYI